MSFCWEEEALDFSYLSLHDAFGKESHKAKESDRKRRGGRGRGKERRSTDPQGGRRTRG